MDWPKKKQQVRGCFSVSVQKEEEHTDREFIRRKTWAREGRRERETEVGSLESILNLFIFLF